MLSPSLNKSTSDLQGQSGLALPLLNGRSCAITGSPTLLRFALPADSDCMGDAEGGVRGFEVEDPSAQIIASTSRPERFDLTLIFGDGTIERQCTEDRTLSEQAPVQKGG
jgi:hypothetical protein